MSRVVLRPEAEEATVECAGPGGLSRAMQCNGLAVPMSHGYRYYTLEPIGTGGVASDGE